MGIVRQPRLLVCAPDWYGVEYVINPWMEEGRRNVRTENARAQWCALRAALQDALGAQVEDVAPQPGLPDMVFTANAGLVLDSTFVPSRFRHPERAREEPFFRAWAEREGFTIRDLPEGCPFEGAGDALFDRGRPILWMGHGFRTAPEAAPALQRLVAQHGFRVEALRLVDPRFYHLDTCFCPLEGGPVLYYPAAFAPESLSRLEALILEEDRIPVSEEDAVSFACNAVSIGAGIVMNNTTDSLRETLERRGYSVTTTPLTGFLCAGGAAKCLSLRLDEPIW